MTKLPASPSKGMHIIGASFGISTEGHWSCKIFGKDMDKRKVLISFFAKPDTMLDNSPMQSVTLLFNSFISSPRNLEQIFRAVGSGYAIATTPVMSPEICMMPEISILFCSLSKYGLPGVTLRLTIVLNVSIVDLRNGFMCSAFI